MPLKTPLGNELFTMRHMGQTISMTSLAAGGRRRFSWPSRPLSRGTFARILQNPSITVASGPLESCAPTSGRDTALKLDAHDVSLKFLGFRHNRPRYAARRASDPQAGAKMDAIAQVLSSPAAGNHVLYEDECDIHLLPTVRSMWMQRGKQIRILTTGTNQKRSVFSALAIRTSGFIHFMFVRKRSAEFIGLLECITVQCPTSRVHTILDYYSFHRARSVQEWLARGIQR